MSEGNEMMEQLQRLLESDATLPQNVTNGLLLAALRHVYKKVNNLETSVSKISDVILLVERFEEDAHLRSETLKVLDESIRGNGKEGLNQRMSVIDKWIENQIWFQRVLIGVIVAELIGLIWHFITP